jgi:hypothetical protein
MATGDHSNKGHDFEPLSWETLGACIEVQRQLGLALEKTTAWERSQERGRKLQQARQDTAEQAWALPKAQALIPGQPLRRQLRYSNYLGKFS